MQRTCTAEDSIQSRSSISTHKVSHSGEGGGGMDGAGAPLIFRFFFNSPPKPMLPRYGAPHPPLINEAPPPHLKNKPPPLKRETTFQNDYLEKTQ